MADQPTRQRLTTLPPHATSVHPGDIEGRLRLAERELRDLQHGHDRHERDLAGFGSKHESFAAQVSRIVDKLSSIENVITVVTTQRSVEEKSRDNLMKWVVGVAISLTVSAIVALAIFMSKVQGAKLP